MSTKGKGQNMGRRARKTRILIVDDDENIRKTLSNILKEKGYVVDAARDGEEAILKSKANFYNLALLDIRLPDMEGTELLAKMNETVPKMVKIILTGYPSMENAIEAVNKGADGYIVKPVNPDKLLSIIKKHLTKQEESKRYTEEKVAEFIKTRAIELGHVPRSR